ncbi:MAG: hypothetical protein AAF922_08145 [Pseudomonadota bacterium]
MSLRVYNSVRQSVNREAILGHETSWKVSDMGMIQFRHGYDPEILEAIRQSALKLKEEHAFRKHLDLTFITGADRFIPEIKDLIQDERRLERLSEFAGTKLEPYPLSVVGSTVTFMSQRDGAVEWHSDGVPITELIPLSVSDPIIGGELEIYQGNCEEGKARVERGDTILEHEILRVPHKMHHSTLGQFVGVLHRTRPITYGERITLVLNSRSVERSFVDDNRMFYLAADNDHDRVFVDEMAQDVFDNQLPAYRKVRHAVEEAPSRYNEELQKKRASW